MHGRITLAPCGHTGETIIGAYVKCLTGCDGKPVMSARGEPGHVDRCTCVRCNIRRDSTHIVLRSRKGVDLLKCEWNGMGEMLTVTGATTGNVANYKFLDASGATVSLGSIEDVSVYKDDIVTLNVKNLIAAITESRTAKYNDIVAKEAPALVVPAAAQSVLKFNGQTITPTSGGPFSVGYTPHSGTAGPVPSGITPALLSQIKLAALLVPGVVNVEVESLTTYVRVLITRFTSAINNSPKWDSEMIAAEIAVETTCAALLPPNVACYVLNRSPSFRLRSAVTQFDYYVKPPNRSVPQAAKYVKDAMVAGEFHKINGGQAAIDGLRVASNGHRYVFTVTHDGVDYSASCPA